MNRTLSLLWLKALGLVALLGVGQALAAPITFSGTGTGSFSSGSCINCSVDNSLVPTITASGGGGLSAIGFIPTGGASGNSPFSANLDFGQSTTINLGAFTAASTVNIGSGPSFNGSGFSLNVGFTAPGSNSGAFTATLNGSLTQSASGVQLTFANPTLTFNAPGGGTFTLTVPSGPLAISAGANTALNAVLSFSAAAPVPEPASLLLLGSGLAGLATLLRKRRQKEA